VLGAVFFVAAIGLLAYSVASRWNGLRGALVHLDPWSVALSLVLACAGLVAQMLSWRALLAGTGGAPPLAPSARVYFLGQLGKYLPGGAWSVLAQAELARRHLVSRTRSAVVALAALAVLLVVGAVVAAAGLVGGAPDALSRYWWVLAVVPLGVAGLVPPVFNRAVALLQRLAHRTGTAIALDARTLGASAAWALAMWLLFGLHAAVLVADLHPGSPLRDTVLSTGAFALAWAVGFLVVIAPAGTGPREAALVLALAPALPATDALLVALVSRVVMVVADAAVAGVAALVARHRAEPVDVTAGTGSP
jgi:hypothetical protein